MPALCIPANFVCFLSLSLPPSTVFCVDKHKQTNSDANAWGNFRNAFLSAFLVCVCPCVWGNFGLETQHTFTFASLRISFFPWPKATKPRITKENEEEAEQEAAAQSQI